MKRSLLLVLFLIPACQHSARLTDTTRQTPGDHSNEPFYMVSCCKDDDGAGNLTYPAFLPPEHIQLCESVRVACRDNDCQFNGATYMPMHVDCGKWGNKIGDEYYAGKPGY